MRIMLLGLQTQTVICILSLFAFAGSQSSVFRSCSNKQSKCPLWSNFCVSSDWVRGMCPATCRTEQCLKILLPFGPVSRKVNDTEHRQSSNESNIESEEEVSLPATTERPELHLPTVLQSNDILFIYEPVYRALNSQHSLDSQQRNTVLLDAQQERKLPEIVRTVGEFDNKLYSNQVHENRVEDYTSGNDESHIEHTKSEDDETEIATTRTYIQTTTSQSHVPTTTHAAPVTNSNIDGEAGELTSRNCKDDHQGCNNWEAFCGNNPWVQENCARTCKTCKIPASKAGNQKSNRNSKRNNNNKLSVPQDDRACKDQDSHCLSWIKADHALCASSQYIARTCLWSCGECGGGIPKEYDVRKLPTDLKPVEWIIGKWRSEFGGKAIFPTIPVFTYGEQLDFKISEVPNFGPRSLNYSAFAWGINQKEELHSEYGFLALKNGSNHAGLTTVMNNGFTTVEEGDVQGNSMRLKLNDIGRISFSRDLPVQNLVREWVLLDSNTLEQTLSMETLTHPMQMHTTIRYKRVYP